MKPGVEGIQNKFIAAARRGDAESFGKLYDAYVSPIYRFILLRVGNRAHAEDLTQDVFVRAWRGIRGYKKRKHVPFSSWLYRIANNAVIDHYRTEREHVDVESREVTEALTGEFSEDFIDVKVQVEEMYVALQHLTDVERQVILMRFIEEMSVREVAYVLQKREGTVRVVQYRGLKKLREHVRED